MQLSKNIIWLFRPEALFNVVEFKCKKLKAKSPNFFKCPTIKKNSLFRLQDVLTEIKVEEILMGMCSQICEREDALLCSDVRDKLFGPMEFSRRDLGSLNIMRGRDVGLPDYNSARAAFNLPPKTKWHDIAPELFDKNPGLEQTLNVAYENRLDNIDAYIGGMLESDGKPGELFHAVIKDQFIRIRDADRFWFENENNE